MPFLSRILGTCGFLFAIAFSTPLEAAHPFYQRLLREGSTALAQKDYAEAQELLRLASFGFLSEPTSLAESLVQLAVAEAEGSQEESFRKTFSRLLEIEERFGAYSQARLGTEMRERFEGVAASRIPEQTLLSIEAFKPLARRIALHRIETLPKSERRTALEELLTQDPSDAEVSMMLAEMELQAGDGAAAAGVLESLSRLQPQNNEIQCLLGQAHSLAGDCERAIPSLEGCSRAPADPNLATSLLNCYVADVQWIPADAFFQRLDPTVASQRSIARVGRRIKKGLRQFLELQAEEAEQASVELVEAVSPPLAQPMPIPAPTVTPRKPTTERTVGSPDTQDPDTQDPDAQDTHAQNTVRTQAPIPPKKLLSSPPPPTTPSKKDLARLEEARRQLAKARLASDLQGAFDLAKEIADRYPEYSNAQHLAAEIAYRGSRWKEAARYFRRGGDPGDGRPNLLFFMAVSYFENGDLGAARSVLERCLPQLQKTPFVSGYVGKILNDKR